MEGLTTFDQLIIIPIASALFLAVVVLVLYIFKNQSKRSEERFKEIEEAGKQRDKNIGLLKENLLVLQTIVIPPTSFDSDVE
jgi:flagellar basal body-associated protein FliL